MAYIDLVGINGTDYDLRDKVAVRYNEAQTLTDVQKQTARNNIGAVDVNALPMEAHAYVGTNYDLALTDANNQAVAVFYNGHIRTKEFDSGDLSHMLNIEIQPQTGSDYDLALSDTENNAILSIAGGHIKTKNFDSRNVPTIDSTFVEYSGEPIRIKRSYIKAETIAQFSFSSGPQGGACYGKYYFQFFNTRNGCDIVDLSTKQIVQRYTFSTSNSKWHCNNANFGTEFYDSADLFPLLYVSMENADVHCVQVLRVSGNVGNLEFTLVQTITWDAPSVNSVYYPNACVDTVRGLLIQIGYKINSYSSATNNAIKINVFMLPALSQGNIDLHDGNKLSGFEVPFAWATQGAFALDGKIYEIFGVEDPTPRLLRMFDIDKQEMATEIDLKNPKTVGAIDVEQEGLFLYDGHIHAIGVTGKLTRFTFVEV